MSYYNVIKILYADLHSDIFRAMTLLTEYQDRYTLSSNFSIFLRGLLGNNLS